MAGFRVPDCSPGWPVEIVRAICRRPSLLTMSGGFINFLAVMPLPVSLNLQFDPLKPELSGQCFATDDELKGAVLQFFKQSDASFYRASIDSLMQDGINA